MNRKNSFVILIAVFASLSGILYSSSKKYKISILLFILMVALGVVLEHKLYETGELSLKEDAKGIFLSAVNTEFDEQYQKLKLPFQYRFSKSESQLNNCIIANANEKSVIEVNNDKDVKWISTSFHKRMEHSILAEESSIKIDSLSLLWNKKLQEAGLVSKNAIRIYLKSSKDTVRLFNGDSTLCIPKYKIANTFYGGLSNEIEIEAFIHYSWKTVMRHASPVFIVLSLLVLSLIILLFLMLLFWGKIQKVCFHTLNVSESRHVETLILGNLRYERHQFYVNDTNIIVRPQIASLLLFFLRQPEYYATKYEITIHLWEAESLGVDNRLRRAISDLRHLLKEESANLEISTEKEGYRLIIRN